MAVNKSVRQGSRLWRLCQKELREILRDRRTIVTLILMPLMVYPILFLAFQRFLVTSTLNEQVETGIQYRLGVNHNDDARLLLRFLSAGHELHLVESLGISADERPTAEQVDFIRTEMMKLFNEKAPQQSIILFPQLEDDLSLSLQRSAIDLAIEVEEIAPPEAPNELPRVRFRLVHQEGSKYGELANQFVKDRLAIVNEYSLKTRAREAGLEYLKQALVVDEVADSKKSPAFSFGALIPLILILMTITGAVYPAIDLTAGERERGTMEALVAAPVPRFHLLLAKYIAVVTVALLTAAANLFAMTLTLYSSGLTKAVFGTATISPQSIVMIFALLVLFAAFFSAVLLAVTSFARSFKEAQAYLIPLMLISLAPGMISLAPGVNFSGILTVAPLVNIVLLAREVFQGTVTAAPATAAIVSTVFYAASAIAIAARIFGTDAVLYGSQTSWSDWLQRPEQTRPHATIAGAMLFLAVLFPLHFYLAGLLSQLPTTNMQFRFSVAGLITIVLFGILPFVVSMITNISVAEAFQLRASSTLSFLAAALLGFSLWPLVHEVFLFQMGGSLKLHAEKIESIQQLVAGLQQIPLPYVLFTLAVIPAIFEEFFFRGFLFTALKSKLTATRTIVISAVLFGLFHFVTSLLSPERFLPSTCMGLVLGWVAWQSKSIFPGIVLHACHNGLLLTVSHNMAWLASKNIGQEEEAHLPAYWIGLAFLGTIAGLIVLRYVAFPRPREESLSSFEVG